MALFAAMISLDFGMDMSTPLGFAVLASQSACGGTRHGMQQHAVRYCLDVLQLFSKSLAVRCTQTHIYNTYEVETLPNRIFRTII